MRDLPGSYVLLALAVGCVAIVGTLWAWGQPLISESGRILLWVNTISSAENSQQIADWYTLSHILHGMLIATFAKIFGRWINPVEALLIAAVTGVAWEFIEHTEWVLDTFRAETIYRGYVGDSVLNAVSDYLFMFAGFCISSRLAVRWSVAIMVAVELFSALIARESLVLTSIRVIHPIQAVSDWQDARQTDAAAQAE